MSTSRIDTDLFRLKVISGSMTRVERSVPDLAALHWPTLAMTGTRAGLTPPQEAALRTAMQEVGAVVLHHGDCKGADERAHVVARELGLSVVIHPPSHKNEDWADCIGKHEAGGDGGGKVRAEPDAEYLERDHDMVNVCDGLMVLPRSKEEQQRGSGTWATYRYAVGANKTARARAPVLKPALMIFPDGSMELRQGVPASAAGGTLDAFLKR